MTKTITINQLIRALHRIRHEHGALWDPAEGCGCKEYAQLVWDHITDHDQRDAEAEREFLKPIR